MKRTTLAVLLAGCTVSGCGGTAAVSSEPTTTAIVTSPAIWRDAIDPDVLEFTHPGEDTKLYPKEMTAGFADFCLSEIDDNSFEEQADQTCSCVWIGIRSSVPYAKYKRQFGVILADKSRFNNDYMLGKELDRFIEKQTKDAIKFFRLIQPVINYCKK